MRLDQSTLSHSAMADYPPQGLEEGIKKLPEWIQLGCGDSQYLCPEKSATFDGDTVQPLPDLSNHQNCLADLLKKKPELYEALKDKKTSMGGLDEE